MMDTRWSPTTKYIVAIGLVLVGIAVFYLSRPIMGMVMIASVLAFVTHPVIRFLNLRWRFPRGLAAITAYLLLLMVLALIPVIITPFALDAIRAIRWEAFVDWFQTQVGGLQDRLTDLRTIEVMNLRLSLAPVVDPILDMLAGTSSSEITSLERLVDLIPTAVNSVTSVAGFLASTVSSVALAIFLTLIISIYLAIDLPKFHRGLINLAPEAYQHEFQTLLGEISHVWSAFLRGQITVSFILFIITWLGATAIGLPGAFVLGLTAGVLALIPSLGPALALVPAVIVALVQGSTYLPVTNLTFALIVLLLYLVIQQMEGNLITPRIVGQAIDLPPVIVLLGVVIGTSTAGLLGALLAAPVIATSRVLFTYAWNKILDRSPFYMLEPEPPAPGRPLVETVRSAYHQLQDGYQALSEAARPWPWEEEEE